jgi:hypothetical protein
VEVGLAEEAEAAHRPRAARPSVDRSAFAGFRFPSEVITVAVRWYLRYGLSYRDQGPVQDTDQSHVFDIESNLQSTQLLTTCDLVSHHTAAESRLPGDGRQMSAFRDGANAAGTAGRGVHGGGAGGVHSGVSRPSVSFTSSCYGRGG